MAAVLASASSCAVDRSRGAPQQRNEPGARLRSALAAVAGDHACDRLAGQFRALADVTGNRSITGTLVVRRCDASNDDSELRVRLVADGWQWVSTTSADDPAAAEQAGYQRFSAAIQLRLAVDISHDVRTRVFTVWLRPKAVPRVTVTPRRGVDAARGLWPAVTDTVTMAFTRAIGSRTSLWLDPYADLDSDAAPPSIVQARFERCAGRRSRWSNLDQVQVTAIRSPRAGRTVDARIYPGGLLMFGPMKAKRPVTVRLRAHGPAPLTAHLLCQADAAALANVYVDGAPMPRAPTPLASQIVRGQATLHVARPRCPSVLVAGPFDDSDANVVAVAWYVESFRRGPPAIVLCADRDD